MNDRLIQIAPGENETLARVMLKLLDRPDAAGRLMTAIGGCAFEDWILSKASECNLRSEDVRKRKLPYDVVVNGQRIQAKSSSSETGVVDVRPCRPVVGSTCRRYSISDFDILAVYLARYRECYFIPVREFVCRDFKGMIAGSFSRKKHRRWMDAWDVVAGLSGSVPTQQMLFY
jgi:hypothetical protein